MTTTRQARGGPGGDDQIRVWSTLRNLAMSNPAWRWNFPLHSLLYRVSYEGRPPVEGPGPAWVPEPDGIANANLASLCRATGSNTYEDLHRWSVEHREAYWSEMLLRLGIVFRTPPTHILDPRSRPESPSWLPGAAMNIAESCFRAERGKPAILYASEAAPAVQRVTYGELWRLSCRVANGLDRLGIGRGGRVALYLPMIPESVAIYVGVILAGAAVVGIADTSAPPELAKRVEISGATVLFTIDGYRRDGKDLAIYEKVERARGPPAIVLPREGAGPVKQLREGDRTWEEFLGERDEFEPVVCRPDDPTNILFSSGTTKDPKAIVWTQTTPIKSAADAYAHGDAKETDVLAWPTSFGWMMGPYLTYASLVNRATMALYVGAPQSRPFGEFVARAGVTFLGVVPKLVRAWKASRAMEGLDWSRVRLFGSTAEPSSPEEMLYLMFLAGYRPVIEYCGGTEVGGGYLTGTLVQPCAPSAFTTPALGLDLVIDDSGETPNRGEVFLVPPSIGLSNSLLNYDHFKEYFEGLPAGPHGELLRRHGDQIERIGGGYYRHHGRIDDMININGVKTSSEEIRSVLSHEAVYDAKPIAVHLEGTGQASLVVYAVPRDPALLKSEPLRASLRKDFQSAIKEKLNPLLAHVHDVVLVPELPQAGPGKTRTMREFQRDYDARVRGGA